MIYSIVWSESALARLCEIADHIAERSPKAALRVIDLLFSRVGGLSKHPRLGPTYPWADDPDLRQLIVGQYRVVYRVVDSNASVAILAVQHGRQLPVTPRDI